MPAGAGEEAERFAAAVELGRSPGSPGDDELARELEIVAMLRARSRALDPTAAAKAQAKQRLLAALAAPAGDAPPRSGRPDAPAFRGPDAAPTELLPQLPGLPGEPRSADPAGARTELAGPGPDSTGPDHTGRDSTGPDSTGRDHTWSDHTGPDHTGADHTGPDHTWSDHTGPDHTGADHTGPDHTGPDHTGPDHTGPDHTGPDHTGPDHTGPDHTGLAATEIDPTEPADGPGTSRTVHGTPSRPGRFGRTGRHSPPNRPAARPGSARSAATRHRRFTLVGSATLLLALVLAGSGILASRDALPGDGLYGVKRVSESAGLALTFDQSERARRHLQLASTRLDEVERLIAANPGISSERPELVSSAIHEFDSSTGEGARMMLDAGTTADPQARAELRRWASSESARLTELKPVLPADAGTDALRLLSRVAGQAGCLGSAGGAGCAATPAAGSGTDPGTGPAGRNGPAGTDPSGTAGSSTGPGATGSDASPSGGGQAPAGGSGLLPGITQGTPLDGVVGGGGSTTDQPSTSNAPQSPDGSQDRSGDDGGGGGGLVNVPPLLPGLPGLGL